MTTLLDIDSSQAPAPSRRKDAHLAVIQKIGAVVRAGTRATGQSSGGRSGTQFLQRLIQLSSGWCSKAGGLGVLLYRSHVIDKDGRELGMVG